MVFPLTHWGAVAAVPVLGAVEEAAACLADAARSAAVSAAAGREGQVASRTAHSGAGAGAEAAMNASCAHKPRLQASAAAAAALVLLTCVSGAKQRLLASLGGSSALLLAASIRLACTKTTRGEVAVPTRSQQRHLKDESGILHAVPRAAARRPADPPSPA